MLRVANTLVHHVWIPFARKFLLAPAAAAAVAAMAAPSTAQAGPRDDYGRPRVDVNIRVGEPHPSVPVYEERQVRVWVPAAYKTVCDRQWCEPVYRTVCDQRWVEPVYRTVCERVWVPEVCETREVRFLDGRHYRTRIERVVVHPGHYENCERRVCVTEGHFEKFDRQELVTAGHWDNIERQVLACDGHYEYRTERVRLADRRDPRTDPVAVVNPILAGLGVRIGR